MLVKLEGVISEARVWGMLHVEPAFSQASASPPVSRKKKRMFIDFVAESKHPL